MDKCYNLRDDPSYSELIGLEAEFDEKCAKMGIVWTDEDVRSEALSEYQNERLKPYNVDKEVDIQLCGYGYKIKAK